MKSVYCLLFFIEKAISKAVDTEKVEFCRKLDCSQLGGDSVCGLRQEGEGFRIRLFENECELMKFGCRVKDEEAYGIVNLKYCTKTFTNNRRQYDTNGILNETFNGILENPCNKINCVHTSVNYLCGLRQEGEGFKIRLFYNECDLLMYNCEKNLDFYTTDIRTCKGMYRPKGPTFMTSPTKQLVEDASPNKFEYSTLKDVELNNEEALPNVVNQGEGAKNDLNAIEDSFTDGDTTTPVETTTVPYETDLPIDYGDSSTLKQTTIPYETDMPIDYENLVTDVTSASTENVKYINGVPVPKNLIILDSGMINYNGNINETMDNFFAATHVFDLPVREVREEADLLHDSFRRMHMRIVRPVKVFKPWIEIPENRTGLAMNKLHQPTLSSCFHACPKVCPDTYAPVCGVPGIVAREPSLMFKNHCFMDAAQCKMRWDDLSETSESSAYIESSFMICLGDNMNGLYRFLPLIRTLQHMGRLKNRGKFHYKVRNMRFRSEYLTRESKPMG